jgi:hypothetical protein
MAMSTPPYGEPDVTARAKRSICARWNLGAIAADGGQSQLILTVDHFPGHGFRATINTTRVRVLAGALEDAVDPMRSVVVYDERTEVRFSQARLDAAYAAALAELRRRATAQDAAVVGHLPMRSMTHGFVPAVVGALVDGDVFSVDGGCGWHICATVLFGSVSVYATPERGADAPTIRIDADRDGPCLRLVSHPTDRRLC